jgi:hypothetical protein
MALARSAGPLLLANDNIALNCIMPAYVDTNLTPNEVTSLWPKEWVTPISTMVRAYDELISATGAVAQDGKSDGANDVVKTGQAVECVVDKLFYRQPVDYPDESQKFCIDGALDVENGRSPQSFSSFNGAKFMANHPASQAFGGKVCGLEWRKCWQKAGPEA